MGITTKYKWITFLACFAVVAEGVWILRLRSFLASVRLSHAQDLAMAEHKEMLHLQEATYGPLLPLSYKGNYSNVRVSDISGDVHSYGYDLEIWTCGNTLVGVWGVHEGLDGDQPHGPLESVEWDSETGHLEFVITLNTGLTRDAFNRDVPARDRFSFQGSLTDTALEGWLSRWSVTHPLKPGGPNRPAPGELIRLLFDAAGTKERREFVEREYPTLAAWNAHHRPSPR